MPSPDQILALTRQRTPSGELGLDPRPGCTAAFAIQTNQEEELAIAQEIRRDVGNLDHIRTAIRKAVIDVFDVAPRAIVLLKPGTLPKTSSGKVQRHACQLAYERSSFERAEATAPGPLVSWFRG
jgi:hypothetical protein